MDTYRNGNSGCGQGENLVAYAYGELEESLERAFENHLRGCQSCPADLAGISSARFAVQEWKSLEFDGLSTPVVEVPVAAAAIPNPNHDVPKATWLSAIRNLFTLSPAWSLTAASVAICVLGAGFVMLMSRGGSDSDIAGTNKANRNGQTTAAAVPDKSVRPSPSNNAPVVNPADATTKDVTGTTDTVPPTSVTPANPATPKTRVVRAVSKPDSSPRPKPDVKSPGRTADRVPVIDDADEDMDDSLRLTELFDEIDTD